MFQRWNCNEFLHCRIPARLHGSAQGPIIGRRCPPHLSLSVPPAPRERTKPRAVAAQSPGRPALLWSQAVVLPLPCRQPAQRRQTLLWQRSAALALARGAGTHGRLLTGTLGVALSLHTEHACVLAHPQTHSADAQWVLHADRWTPAPPPALPRRTCTASPAALSPSMPGPNSCVAQFPRDPRVPAF